MDDFKTYISERENMDLFLSKYETLVYYEPPGSRITKRIPKTERICRFCQKISPDVSFKNEPHIIPELLGKNSGVSDFECDNCNQHFSRYETDFADFLGLVRSFYFTQGKGNIPTFKSPGESLVARMETLQGGKKALGISDNDKGAISVNTETGETTISYLKNSYTPINVFKSLIKIALTILPENEFRFYGEINHFISDEENHEYYAQFAQVLNYTTTARITNPCCYIFQRKRNVNEVPKHVFMLYFENFIYQVFIPRYALDEPLYNVGKFTSYYCPPILQEVSDSAKTCVSEIIDLSDTALVRKQKGTLKYQLDPKVFANAKIIDPVTKEKTDFDPNGIVKINIFKIDEHFDRERFEAGEGF